VSLLQAKTPSHLVVEDGQYAEGRRIMVTHGTQDDAASKMHEELEFLLRIQQPGDKVTLECETVSTRKGNLTSCQLSFARNSVETRPA
jgi:hypothetical protein